MIEIILKADVEHLGRRGDIVKVAPGYARNYLLPRKLALAVTDANKRVIEHEKKLAAEREAHERNAAGVLAKKIGETPVTIARKAGETATLFGSVTAADIAAALAERGVEVDRRKIQLGEPIKHLGEATVPVRLHRDVVAQVTVHVVKEEAAGPAAEPGTAADADTASE
jgi:large subunit ribosomal protein L9